MNFSEGYVTSPQHRKLNRRLGGDSLLIMFRAWHAFWAAKDRGFVWETTIEDFADAQEVTDINEARRILGILVDEGVLERLPGGDASGAIRLTSTMFEGHNAKFLNGAKGGRPPAREQNPTTPPHGKPVTTKGKRAGLEDGAESAPSNKPGQTPSSISNELSNKETNKQSRFPPLGYEPNPETVGYNLRLRDEKGKVADDGIDDAIERLAATPSFNPGSAPQVADYDDDDIPF